jgi:GNAT superfamily N-acetyltransferase
MTSEHSPGADINAETAQEIVFRRVDLADANTIAKHRLSMFRDMGYRNEAELESMGEKFLPWLQENLKSGEYVGWFALSEGGVVVAGAGLWLLDWPPHMRGSNPKRGYIFTVYTEPQFRGRGLARSLMETTLRWCKDNGIDFVTLHASEQGRQIYAKLGFEPSNEMRIKL